MKKFWKKSDTISNLIFLLGISCILVVFFTPLWQINLSAPQYPEGLTMFIHFNDITGDTENDLHNINLLNHYIGMNKIEANSIPELKYMKYILVTLLLIGIFALLFRRKQIFLTWTLVAIFTGIVGIYDMNAWGTEFGSNLDPTAPIKVEGMTYKPPLFGEKQLLNITASSYPAAGGIFFGLSIIFSAIATFIAYKRPFQNNDESRNNTESGSIESSKLSSFNSKKNLFKKKTMKLHLPILFLLIACSVDVKPIKYGKEQCDNCSMIISDARFGSELLTNKGKVYKFDSAECLTFFLKDSAKIKQDNIHSMFVTNFLEPNSFIETSQANFLITEKIPSPMGANLSAYKSRDEAISQQQKFGGDIFSFEKVVQQVLQK